MVKLLRIEGDIDLYIYDLSKIFELLMSDYNIINGTEKDTDEDLES